MLSRLQSLGSQLRARAENVLAAMMATMFIVFIIQIIFRYVINLPIGWTHEISVIMWVWLVLFGTAFVVRDDEEIRFDLIYGTASPRTRRTMVVASATAVVFFFGLSLPAVVDYVTFMKVEHTAYLKIRFDFVYSIYAVFAAAVIVRQIWLGYRAIRGSGAEPLDVSRIKSGV